VLSVEEDTLKWLDERNSISPENEFESGKITFSAGTEFLIVIEKLKISPTVKESIGPEADTL
jgi:hypothetical protein